MTSVRFTVAVILQRTRLANRWATERWEPVAVEVTTTEVAGIEPVRLPDVAAGTRWRFDGHMLELHRSEAEGYFLNVTAPEPKVFVALRPTESDGEPRIVPASVTVSYNEAARMLDGGAEVEAVQMPPQVRAALEAFVAVHYRPEPKRKVRRNDPFADAARRREEESSR